MTEEELQAGLDRVNAVDPPEYWPSPLLAIYRHPCMGARIAKRTGRPVSTAIDLHERYVVGWFFDSAGSAAPREDPGAEIAILYREGSCKHCGQTARSRRGRFVRTDDRPPVMGRVARS